MQPNETVWRLTNAFVTSRSLQVVAELGVADCIEDGPVAVKDLAAACGADPDALDRVLRLLASQGVFERRGDAYGHTDASRLLRGDHPMSMAAFPRMMGLPSFLAMFDQLEHSVRTGSPAANLVDPQGLWAYFQRHPSEGEVLGHAMAAKAAADIAGVLSACDFRAFATVADIGGGRGHLLRAILAGAPAARGILFDLPAVIASFDLGAERLTLQSGDFFVDPLPAADAYVLMEVIHDWADAEAAAILRAVRRAAAPGARVLLVENVLADEEPDPRGHTLDVIMLAVTGGRERTAAEFTRLLEGAGFSGVEVIGAAGPLRVVSAVADENPHTNFRRNP